MNDAHHRSLPPILTEKLADFRKRVRLIKFVEGILAALFGLALSYLLVFALDRLGETPGWLRGLLLIAGAAIPGLGLPLLWHRWVWRQRRLEDVARLVRRHFPRLGDQLLGIVELARDEHDSVRHATESERLIEAAMDQAADAVKDRSLAEAVPSPHHGRWAFAAGAVLLIAILAWALVPEAARNALARWLMPWSQVERFTFARFEPLPETLVVPWAEAFELPARIADDSRWRPEKATAHIPGQPKLRIDATEDGAFPFAFRPQKDDTTIFLAAGDDREKVELKPRMRPEPKGLSAHVRLPDYLKYSHEPVIEIRGGTVRLLGDAEVSWEIAASRELATATLDGKPAPVKDGRLLTGFEPVKDGGEREFNWQDSLGLSPRDPLQLMVQAVEDEAPGIAARRESQEQVVLDTEVVAFDLTVQDDFGIRQAGIEWTGVKTADGDHADHLTGEKIAAAGEPEKRHLDARATFCAARENIPPQTLEIRAWAEDYLPGRERAKSATFVLHVLDATDHALWLTGQFGKWLDAARETYEREQQLHQTNKELRQLNSSELDRPENRRRVSRQAADESANARRLDAITDAGQRLAEMATRNPEFDAERLETWATMLKSLGDIADQRMPSVADLLKQSAGARGKKPSKPSDPSKTASNSNGKPKGKPGEGKAGGKSKPSGPSLTNGPNLPSVPGKPKETAPGGEEHDPVPSIADNEGGFLDPPKPPEDKGDAPPKPPGKPKFGLPSTTLGAIDDPNAADRPPPAETPAQEKLDGAIEEQRDLLAEFARVSDQLAELLASLEASTFVKRLKAASRAQMEIATDLNTKTLEAFGLEKKDSPEKPAANADAISGRAREQSETVYIIQSDLAAYADRKSDLRFTGLLNDMKDSRIVRALDDGSIDMQENLSGQSISGSEFWADTLDRWAEELVAAAQCSSCSSCSGDSLPPEIVLKVMQALRDEMSLRDETRELENGRPALEWQNFVKKANPLARSQNTIATNIEGVIEDIEALPRGDQRFSKELKLLTMVQDVMEDARGILDRPETGAEAIAAETEAIELLLQARRMKPGSGGGGGSNPGGGGGAATASSAALAGLGPGSDANTDVIERNVGQSTGRAGREFPEEFKSGLDAYFHALEKEGAVER